MSSVQLEQSRGVALPSIKRVPFDMFALWWEFARWSGVLSGQDDALSGLDHIVVGNCIAGGGCAEWLQSQIRKSCIQCDAGSAARRRHPGGFLGRRGEGRGRRTERMSSGEDEEKRG